MTPKEHFLVFTLFTKHLQLLRILADTMKNNGIDVSDFDAVEYAATSDPKALHDVSMMMWQKYVGLAKALGVETGLENHPPPAKDDSIPNL